VRLVVLTAVNEHGPAEPPGGDRLLRPKCGIGLGVFALGLAAILFVPAGRLDWWGAWAYIGLLAGGGIVSTPILLRVNPAMVEERFHLRRQVAQRTDVVIGSVMTAFWLLALVEAGLDRRFGWSPGMSPLLQCMGLVIGSAGYAFSMWAMAVNKFFALLVRIQKERGHMVVTSGPYRWVRHPGYAGGILLFISTPLILGSQWAYIPMGLATLSLVLRTAAEDKSLHEGLDGYREYACKVPYRLLPYVW
jgi:protein-S-isoprenylcysteine O-methyltransferase Ste14